MKEEGQHKPDVWTRITFLTDFAVDTITGAMTYGSLFDSIVESCGVEVAQSIFGISPYSIGAGAMVAFAFAAGSSYAEYKLNSNHQHSGVIVNDVPLTAAQKCAIGATFLSYIGYYGAIPSAMIMAVDTKANVPGYGKLLASCGASLWGALAAVAPTRTRKAAIQTQNANGYLPILPTN